MDLSGDFFLKLLGIILVDLVLAGDNAVVIALAARNLPRHLQMRAIILGGLAAVILRSALTVGATLLLSIPLLGAVGGLLLLHIGWKLAVEEEGDPDVESATTMRAAVVTILMADLVMSIDNVLAVAGTAHGDVVLVMLGLVISIPIVLGGATLVLSMIERMPWLVWAGAGLIIYVGTELIINDRIVQEYILEEHFSATWMHRAFGLVCAASVITAAVIKVTRRRQQAQEQAETTQVSQGSDPRLMVEASPPDE